MDGVRRARRANGGRHADAQRSTRTSRLSFRASLTADPALRPAQATGVRADVRLGLRQEPGSVARTLVRPGDRNRLTEAPATCSVTAGQPGADVDGDGRKRGAHDRPRRRTRALRRPRSDPRATNPCLIPLTPSPAGPSFAGDPPSRHSSSPARRFPSCLSAHRSVRRDRQPRSPCSSACSRCGSGAEGEWRARSHSRNDHRRGGIRWQPRWPTSRCLLS